ncbi:MAG: glutamate synthase subunit alpha, partial [Actinomycetes bacterium]
VVRLPKATNPDFGGLDDIIAGNVMLYGATGGTVFARGVVGERFCVRNSGATAVVEGVGDHGCEYMTGGRAVVLGPTGRNFGAGMSGGIAYVYDADGSFPGRLNNEMVALEDLDATDESFLAEVVAAHAEATDSEVARALLGDWSAALGRFRKVMPKDYRRVLEATRRAEENGLDVVEEIMRASQV